MKAAVFVGAPSILTPQQDSALRRWISALAETGLSFDAVGRRDYQSNPWQQLRQRIEAADGVILFGFRQLHVYRGTWRPDTPETGDVDSQYWTSPWLQVEAGLAVGLGRPLLIVGEPGVSEGVFHPQSWADEIFGTRVDADLAGPAIMSWRSCLERRTRPGGDRGVIA